MGGLIFQYGTAAHLALLTAAPLILYSVCGPTAHAAALFWLSLFAAIWVVMNPSPRFGEWPRDARHRIGGELLRDPFLLVVIAAIVFSASRAINGGVALAYDAAAGLWHLTGPSVSILPGSVSGCGQLPLAGVVALSVVTLGVRHALGSRARFVYLLSSATLAVFAVVAWRMLTARGIAVPGISFSPEDPFCLGTLLGPFLLFSVVAWIESWSLDSVVLEMVAAVSVSGILFGILCQAPSFTIFVFGSIALVLLIVGVLLSLTSRSMSAWFRSAIALAIVVAPIGLVLAEDSLRPVLVPVFPKGFGALRAVTTAIAVEAWKGAPQLGVGLGAFPLALGFGASPEDWKVVSDAQTAVPNGWIHFLFERGIIGAVVFLSGAGVLLKDLIVRFIRADGAWRLAPSHLLAPAVLVATVTATFVECSFLRPESLLSLCAALALTAAAIPDSQEVDHG